MVPAREFAKNMAESARIAPVHGRIFELKFELRISALRFIPIQLLVSILEVDLLMYRFMRISLET